MKDEVRITIRLPRHMREGLKELAAHDKRSLNTYLLLRLAEFLRSEGKEA